MSVPKPIIEKIIPIIAKAFFDDFRPFFPKIKPAIVVRKKTGENFIRNANIPI
jgi:hypothetical protein